MNSKYQIYFILRKAENRIMKSKADMKKKKKKLSNSLAAQWLELDAFTAAAWVQSLVGKLRSHKPWDRSEKKNNNRKQHLNTSSQCQIHF